MKKKILVMMTLGMLGLMNACGGGMEQTDSYTEQLALCVEDKDGLMERGSPLDHPEDYTGWESAYIKECDVQEFEFTYYCDDYANEDYSCPEGYIQTDRDESCTGTATIKCEKCTVTDASGNVVLEGSKAAFVEEEALCAETDSEETDK